MPKKVQNIRYKDLLLPEFLFYKDDSKSKNISPVATFNPVAVVDGRNAWQSSITPSKEPKQKVIIFDKSLKDICFDNAESLAFIAKAKNAGFRIVLKVDDGFFEVPDDLSEVTTKLSKVTKRFDEKSDYEKLTKLQIARDKAIVLGFEKVELVKQGFFRNQIAADYLNIKIDSMNLVDVINFIKNSKLKSFVRSLLSEYKHLIQGVYELSEIIQAIKGTDCEDLIGVLLENDLIIEDIEGIIELIEVVKDTEYKDKIGDWLKISMNKVKDASKLVAIINAIKTTEFKDYIKDFLSNKTNVIKDIYEFASLVNAVKDTAFIDFIGEDLLITNLNKIRDSAELAVMIKAIRGTKYENLIRDLLETHKDKIKGIDDVNEIIGNLQGLDFQEQINNLLRDCTEGRDDVNKIAVLIEIIKVTEYRDHIPDLLKGCGNKVESGYELAAIIKAIKNTICRDQVKDFLEKNEDIIEDIESFEEFLEVFKAIKGTEYENRIRDFLVEIDSAEELIQLVNLIKGTDCEDLIPKLLEEHESKMKMASDLVEIISAIRGTEHENLIKDLLNSTIVSQEWKVRLAGEGINKIIDVLRDTDISIQDFFSEFSDEFICSFTPDFVASLMEKNKYKPIGLLRDVASSDANETNLYLRNLDENLIAEIKQNKNLFENIVALRVERCLDVSLLNDLLEFLPNLKFAILPDDLKGSEIKASIDYKFDDFTRYGFGRDYGSSRIDDMLVDKKYKKLFVARQDEVTPDDVDLGDEVVEFEMVVAGEILNCELEDEPKMRSKILLHNPLQDLSQREYFPDDDYLKKIGNPQYLQEDKIEEFKDKDFDDDGIYYQFNLPLKSGQKFRLLSASSDEKFLGYKTNPANIDVEFFKGDDDFIYAVAKQDCTMTHFVRTDKEENTYEALPRKHQARRIIAGYVKKEDGSETLPQYDPQNHQQWMKQVFDEALGSCHHKALAVGYKLLKAGFKKEDLRFVDINNNHVVLEIRHEGRWYVADVGGGSNYKEIYSDREYAANSMEEANQIGSSSSSKTPATSTIQTGLQKAQNKIKEVIKKKLSLEKLMTNEDLLQKTINSKESRIMILIDDEDDDLSAKKQRIANHANFLISQARKSGREVFYIDSVDKIAMNKKSVVIGKDGKPVIKNISVLIEFLQSAEAPLIIVDWSKFNSRERTALNTLLDEQGSVLGVSLPKNAQVISIVDKKPKDFSFISRHQVSFSSNLDQERQSNKLFSEPRTIDLEGFSNAKECLFGKIILVKNKMQWQKSEFVKCLERGENNFELLNISDDDFAELEYEFNQAKAFEKIIYQGYEIAIPENFALKKAVNNLDFTKFEPCKIKKSATSDQIPKDTKLINSYLFDQLLCQKSVIDGFYEEKEGLIADVGKSDDKTLKLFISANLSENQFYCLLNQAKKAGVELELYLAEGVVLPSSCRIEIISAVDDSMMIDQYNRLEDRTLFMVEDTVPYDVLLSHNGDYTKALIEVKSRKRKLNEEVIQPKKIRRDKVPEIFVSDNPAKIISNIEIQEQNSLVINVEDLTYQDLITQIVFTETNQQFENFQEIQSAFIEKLKNQKIVLTGQFSDDLLQMLHPLLAGEKPFDEVVKNLTVIIEDREISGREAVYKPLSFLPKSAYEIRKERKSEVKKAEIYREENNHSFELPQDTKKESDEFIKQRETKFIEMLKSNSMLQLIGDSGVGKSRLMRTCKNPKKYGIDSGKNEEDQITVYNEMDSFENWANDKSKKNKILFIDESNIEDTHFTTFSPLKNGKKILYHKGKFYELDANHKVVFAKNPLEYGGGRVEQKLFEDGDIAEMHLDDFPASYIYEKLLKKVIYDKLSEEIKERVSEEDFKNECQRLIKNFKEVNVKNQGPVEALTARELQEQVLEYLVKKIDKEKKKEQKIQTPNFVSTTATKESEDALSDFIKKIKYQKEGQFPAKAVGINGVLLKGASGVGKSKMIEAVFAENNILDIKTANAEQQQNKEQQFYYKIDANLPLEEKKKIIVQAFNEGNLIWLDELDSCIDDGLEKILNSVLTGFHPDTGKRAENSGFGVVTSVNSSSMEGRSLISPALCHRMKNVEVKSLKEYEIDDLRDILRVWTSEANSAMLGEDQVVGDLFALFHDEKESQDFNLRVVKQAFPEIVEKYRPATSLQGEFSTQKRDFKISSILNYK